MLEGNLRISLCTVKSFEPRSFTPSGARADQGQAPRMAIMALAHWMEKNGYPKGSWDYYDVDLLMPSDEVLEQYFRDLNPEVIGLSAIVCSYYVELKRIAEIARRACPDAWIVMGGHLSASSKVVLNKTPVDICVAGDGEYPWVELLGYFERNGREWKYDELRKIRGAVFLDGDGEMVFDGYAKGVPGGDLIQPDYDLLQAGLKDQPELIDKFFSHSYGIFDLDIRVQNHWSTKGAQLISSKGCVAKCTFCQRATKGYRRADIDSIEEHVLMVKEKFGVGVILFTTEENFGSDVAQAKQIADLMQKHDMLWIAGSMRVTTFSEDEYRYLVERGCLGGVFGLESGSPMMLDLIEKKITTDEMVEAFQRCVNAGFTTNQSIWLAGNPGDTEQSMIETGRTSARLAHVLGVPPWIDSGGVGYVIPIPGTPLYEYAQQVGVLGSDTDAEERYLVHLATIETAYKQKYANVNGADRAEVMFWDIVMRMEASRTYRELCRKEPPRETVAGKRALDFYVGQRESGEVNRSFRVRLSSMDFFIGNSVVDAMPRWFIYPLVKWSNYWINGIAKDIVSALLGVKREKGFPSDVVPPRLNLDPKVAPRDRGLRVVVRSTAEQLTKVTDISQRLLTRGQ